MVKELLVRNRTMLNPPLNWIQVNPYASDDSNLDLDAIAGVNEMVDRNATIRTVAGDGHGLLSRLNTIESTVEAPVLHQPSPSRQDLL